MVDIGTGDGAFAYQIAKENPQALVIGIDPCHENLIDISLKSIKKPSKGGLLNIFYVLANVENLPDELNGLVDNVYINFPWGSLLQGIVLVKESTFLNIKKICKKNATIQIICGYNILYDKKEMDRLSLPSLDEAYINNFMIPKLEKIGFKIINIKKLKASDLNDYPTTWAKKLSFGSDRDFYSITLSIW